jgi:hypothetical protein
MSTPSNLKVKSTNNYQQTTQQLLDPHTSSDFSELEKKEAEIKAKFQETKTPNSNAVTLQSDASKVFTTTTTKTTTTTTTTNSTTNVNKNIDNSITNNKFLQPKPFANKTNTANNDFKKTNTTNLISTQVEKRENISNSHAQVSASSLSLSSSSTNSSSSPSMSSTFRGKKRLCF